MTFQVISSFTEILGDDQLKKITLSVNLNFIIC